MHAHGFPGHQHTDAVEAGAAPTRAALARRTGKRALSAALTLTLGYMVVEIVGGWATNSLALISDAAHMFTDAIALGLGLFGIWIADQPATEHKTYGYHRAEILVALLNGLVLWLVVLGVFWEAWQRVATPPSVHGAGVLGVATVGLAVNLIAAWMLSGAASANLSVRGALLHVLSDLLGSVGVIAAGIVILVTGWNAADAMASVIIAVLILVSSFGLIREAVDVLMEAVPRHIDLDDLRRTLEEVPGATEVHDLHVWSLTTGHCAVSAHAVVDESATTDHVLAEMTDRLAARFDIHHVTIQLEVRNRRHAEPTH
jgi:cobalt-zinc-cadmium efflux system protein